MTSRPDLGITERECCAKAALVDDYAAEIARLRAEVEKLQAIPRDVVEWWSGLPSNLRQDIEGSGYEPGAIARCRAALAPNGEQSGK